MNITNIIKEEIEDFKWIEDVSIEFPLNYEPSPGDKLICKKGFKQDWDSSKYGTASQDLEYGGGGYVPGKIITVSSITTHSGGYPQRTVVWPRGDSGIFINALAQY